MSNKIVYFVFFPRKWKLLSEYDILITKGNQLGELLLDTYLEELFLNKDFDWELYSLEFSSEIQFNERLKKAGIICGHDQGAYFIRNRVTPRNWAHFQEMEKIEKLTKKVIDKKIRTPFIGKLLKLVS